MPILPTFDATRISTRLYVGSYPIGTGPALLAHVPPFTLLALCAAEAQEPPGGLDRLTIVRCPLDDGDLKEVEKINAQFVAASIYNHIESGGRALITCAAGLNRSALVAGLVLVRGGMAPAVALQLLRATRGKAPYVQGALVLNNRDFCEFLLGLR